MFPTINGKHDLIWIDTQGHEAKILSGANNLITSGAPVVMEFWPYALKRSNSFGDLKKIIKEEIVEPFLIQEGFIQSAYNVSAGGLAVAIALSLIIGEEGIGARIHLSRKIRNDELLFGETQGLILISFGENNFIKFERICMQKRIPATTIGRVTGDEKFTFNNLINVNIKDMKNLVNLE